MTALTDELVAEACHEVNRVIQKAAGEKPSAHWEDASQRERDDTAAGVAESAEDDASPEERARARHENWADRKRDQGWRYGAVKDEAAKTHPLLVPWEELDELARLKDVAFGTVVDLLSGIPE